MKRRSWEIIGAPFDLGSSHTGSSGGPARIRAKGLTSRVDHLRSTGVDVVDGGDVEAPAPSPSGEVPRGLTPMTDYAVRLGTRVEQALDAGRVPIVLGGDHSLPIATCAAVSRRHAAAGAGPVGIVWVDAHPDLETPGPESTNDLHAMSAAHLLGHGGTELDGLDGLPAVGPQHIAMIGLRDVVKQERDTIRELDITAFSMSDVERLGITRICESVFGYMQERTTSLILSFDIDSLDPSVAPGVDYPEPGGLTAREAFVIMEFAFRSENLALLEMVEVNPNNDREDVTANLAARLIYRAMTGPPL